ncbi:MAG: hypothetical protein E7J99_13295, partial [Clostridium butyricum]|uniref:hypothetical protein n=1 Tax=Clostridium sp. TaxID=1506 RepID=UPI0029039714
FLKYKKILLEIKISSNNKLIKILITQNYLNSHNAYYLNKDGSMASGTTVDGFMLADSGVAISLY